jgi:N-sulfoglucosamine sulfohydrolase
MRCFLAILLALIPSVAWGQSKPKNVLLIIADDLGMQVGCYGNGAIQTPNIDALAKRGIRFTKAYATVASCSPSRASIYTGLFSHQNGQYGLQHATHKQECYPWVQGLPNLLRAVGYYTGLIGKFHVGPDSSFNFNRMMVNTGGRNMERFAQLTRGFIKEADNKPFFLVVAYQDPHRDAVGFGNKPFAGDPKEKRYNPKDVIVPYYLPDCDDVRKDLAEYYQSIARMDRGIGLLLDLLRETGHLDDTLIIFISDNGPPFPGAKTTLYDVGLHLPLIIAGPDMPAGRTNNALVSYIDLAPTILDWAKAKMPSYKQTKLIGKSILPIVNNDNPKGWDAVFGSHQFHEITMYYPMRTIVTSRYQFIVNLDHENEFPHASDLWGSPSWQTIRNNKFKMMGKRSVAAYLHRPREELYDLVNDPDELTNLAGDGDPAHERVGTDLRRRLRQWQQQTNDPWLIVYREEK